MQIFRNVGNVPGLHVATDVFDEQLERHLFFLDDERPFRCSAKHARPPQLPDGSDRVESGWYAPECRPLPREVYQLENAIRDSGLHPGMLTTDFALFITNPKPSRPPFSYAFGAHFDSRYRWGETVIGVTLGQGCKATFDPADTRENAGRVKATFKAAASSSGPLIVEACKSGASEHINVFLPRRSIYVMSSSSRVDFKHAIHQMSAHSLRFFPPPPPWNPHGHRRAITLRSTKPYADALLARLHANERDAARRSELKARLEKSLAYKATYTFHGGTPLDGSRLDALVQAKLSLLDQLEANGTAASRFPPERLCFAPVARTSFASPERSRAVSAPVALYADSGLAAKRALLSAEEAEAAEERALQQAILASMRGTPARRAAALHDSSAGSADAADAAAPPGSAAGSDRETRRALLGAQRAAESVACDVAAQPAAAGCAPRAAGGKRARSEPLVIDLTGSAFVDLSRDSSDDDG